MKPCGGSEEPPKISDSNNNGHSQLAKLLANCMIAQLKHPACPTMPACVAVP